MQEKLIASTSFLGVKTKNKYVVQNGDALAVILPGAGYTAQSPLLYYAVSIALESGYDVLAVEYGFQRTDKDFELTEATFPQLVKDTCGTIRKAFSSKNYKRILFIGKSLGTYIQAHLTDEFAQYEQEHIFLTPMGVSIGAIKRTKCLVIAGTDDAHFTAEHMRNITGLENAELRIIEGADHSLEKDSYKESLGILSQVCEYIRDFINK